MKIHSLRTPSRMKMPAPPKTKRHRDWGPDEEPECEIESITFEKRRGFSLPAIVIRLTPRGAREKLRRDREEKAQHRKYMVQVKLHPERYFPDASFYL